MLKVLTTLVFLLVGISFAQLVQKKTSSADTLKLKETQPLVLVGDSTQRIQALDDTVSLVNAEPTLQETAKTMAIKKGFEILGETLKNSLSPNSPEADAAMRELEYR